ncbi:MAG: hypothetical protein ACI9H8_000192 [Lysobacterales bacterium]|jgi:hypothetical protein
MKKFGYQGRFYTFLVLAWLVSLPAIAEVYKTIDEDGNVVYTDQAPEPGAEPVKLRELSIISPQVAYPVPSAAEGQADTGDGIADGQIEVTSLQDLKRGYSDFAILSPRNDQQFIGTQNVASVSWTTRYRLQEGMAVVLYLNGVAQAPSTNSIISVDEVWRGEHTVYANLIDSRGRTIATTSPVTFHVRQYSVNSPGHQNRGG